LLHNTDGKFVDMSYDNGYDEDVTFGTLYDDLSECPALQSMWSGKVGTKVQVMCEHDPEETMTYILLSMSSPFPGEPGEKVKETTVYTDKVSEKFDKPSFVQENKTKVYETESWWVLVFPGWKSEENDLKLGSHGVVVPKSVSRVPRSRWTRI
jgi:hypothetical protein